MITRAKNWVVQNVLYIAWTIALVGMIASLIFSEVMNLPPCNLCWYQRILLYPLVLILPIGIIKKDKLLHHYVFPFSILGAIVAFYHTLLQANIIPENLAPCSFGISCVTKTINYFGFITIPLLSFLAFVTIGVCMFIYKKLTKSSS
jgi:disulfide bond formation protein DsbB